MGNLKKEHISAECYKVSTVKREKKGYSQQMYHLVQNPHLFALQVFSWLNPEVCCCLAWCMCWYPRQKYSLQLISPANPSGCLLTEERAHF